MTKVIRLVGGKTTVMAVLLAATAASSLDASRAPAGVQSAAVPRAGTAQDLYLKLKSAGLDPSRVYRIRDVTLDRAAVHLTLDDGVIGFMQDVGGHISGAVFEGEGEVLLSPPDRTERSSMALFTGEAILEEAFTTAFIRFNDNTYAELQPYLLRADEPGDFLSRWNDAARIFAEGDALRLFLTYSRGLPVTGVEEKSSPAEATSDQFLHVRLFGKKLGAFDVGFDSEAPEQVWAGRQKTVDGIDFYDMWTSFSVAAPNATSRERNSSDRGHSFFEDVKITDYKIRAKVTPPTRLEGETRMHVEVQHGGRRALLFELSGSLDVSSIELNGSPLEFIHNPPSQGSQHARPGNDLVAVVLPQTARSGQAFDLRFVYSGDVLSEAGPGLLYVGARGTWYPNAGTGMANFDLQFEYPSGWTLVATGKEVEQPEGTADASAFEKRADDRTSRWVSQRPIPVAGFNLGKYQRAVAKAGDVTVEAYATSVVENSVPQNQSQMVLPDRAPTIAKPGNNPEPARPGVTTPPAGASPARNAQSVANDAAAAIGFFSRYFGPYPADTLILTQMPGKESQGWPGLIYLSSFAFLNSEELSRMSGTDADKLIAQKVVIPHETAHQWWGHLVDKATYRDQWWVEALANYSALMLLESENPAQFHQIMDKYRDDLLVKSDTRLLLDDGPVTLGTRLSNSEFPSGYIAISYGRGTWLFHMLRSMMRDAETDAPGKTPESREEPFLRALHTLREKCEGRSITTSELLTVFEQQLPPSARFEQRKSLDWFYQGWIDGTAIPIYELSQLRFVDREGGTLVSGMLEQKSAPDNLVTSVPIYASVRGKLTLLGRVFADGPETSFHFMAPAGTRKVVVDPHDTVLRRVH
ncbi:MAG TPA: M1 family aminopeptidase [Terriglobales bacterium]